MFSELKLNSTETLCDKKFLSEAISRQNLRLNFRRFRHQRKKLWQNKWLDQRCQDSTSWPKNVKSKNTERRICVFQAKFLLRPFYIRLRSGIRTWKWISLVYVRISLVWLHSSFPGFSNASNKKVLLAWNWTNTKPVGRLGFRLGLLSFGPMALRPNELEPRSIILLLPLKIEKTSCQYDFDTVSLRIVSKYIQWVTYLIIFPAVQQYMSEILVLTVEMTRRLY